MAVIAPFDHHPERITQRARCSEPSILCIVRVKGGTKYLPFPRGPSVRLGEQEASWTRRGDVILALGCKRQRNAIPGGKI